MRIARRIAIDGAAVLIVLHDLNLAAQYSDRLVLMKSGRIAASGTPAEVMREDLIGEVFGVRPGCSQSRLRRSGSLCRGAGLIPDRPAPLPFEIPVLHQT